jgi:Berberine and berberine like
MRAPAALSDLAMDPREPLPYRFKHSLIDELAGPAIDEIASIALPGSALAIVQLRHIGGALRRHAPGAGARATLPGEIAVFGLGVAPDPALVPAVEAQIDGVISAVAPYRAGVYPNFVEQPADASAFFDPATWTRLRQVKAAWDPEDVFKADHRIPPAEAVALAA